MARSAFRAVTAACFRAFNNTYRNAFRTSRGVRSSRAWYRSATTLPRFRPITRFTASANRDPIDIIPRPSAC